MDTTNRALFLYDGLCGFCNSSVQWVLKRDSADQFRFAPQQSAVAQEILLRHGIDQQTAMTENSVYLVDGLGGSTESLLRYSDVTIRTLILLGGFWWILGNLLNLVPKYIRDAGYRMVARNRFRLAGRFDACPIPTPAQRAKFL